MVSDLQGEVSCNAFLLGWGTADTFLFFLQNQLLCTAQQARSVLRAGARLGLCVASPAEAPSQQGARRSGSYSSLSGTSLRLAAT